jgi:hypothetical protein
MKPLKRLVVMSYHTFRKCVKVLHRINGCLATKDNCDSWRMCATLVDSRTIMIVMLTVMSCMDPHTIRITCVGMVGKLGVGHSCTLGRATAMDSVVCLMSHFEEKSF